jgi:hypothetical protein
LRVHVFRDFQKKVFDIAHVLERGIWFIEVDPFLRMPRELFMR